MKIWDCKIGEVDEDLIPNGADAPMRVAVRQIFFELTGQQPTFIFSGWGATLTEDERAVVENRAPDPHRDFRARLETEHIELAAKFDGLHQFITHSPRFSQVGHEQRALLRRQRTIMADYLDVLGTRIALIDGNGAKMAGGANSKRDDDGFEVVGDVKIVGGDKSEEPLSFAGSGSARDEDCEKSAPAPGTRSFRTG